MNEIAQRTALPAMQPEMLGKVYRYEQMVLAQEQVPMATHHVLHAGMYARTIMVPAGVTITGALVKIPTLLIVSGECAIYIGDDVLHVDGHCVLPASAGRKQAFLAYQDTELTMVFPTAATTVEQAEQEFTDEWARLMSRDGINYVTITGE